MRVVNHGRFQHLRSGAQSGCAVLLLIATLGAWGAETNKQKTVEIKVRELDAAEAAKVGVVGKRNAPNC